MHARTQATADLRNVRTGRPFTLGICRESSPSTALVHGVVVLRDGLYVKRRRRCRRRGCRSGACERRRRFAEGERDRDREAEPERERLRLRSLPFFFPLPDDARWPCCFLSRDEEEEDEGGVRPMATDEKDEDEEDELQLEGGVCRIGRASRAMDCFLGGVAETKPSESSSTPSPSSPASSERKSSSSWVAACDAATRERTSASSSALDIVTCSSSFSLAAPSPAARSGTGVEQRDRGRRELAPLLVGFCLPSR